MVQCGACGSTLKPGMPGECCVAKTFERMRKEDAKLISDLRGHIGSLKERLRKAQESLSASSSAARASASQVPPKVSS